MIFDSNNPWLVAIISGVIVAIFAWFLFYIHEYREEKLSKAAIVNLLNEGDALLEKNMNKDALVICQTVLKTTSIDDDPRVYGHIKNNVGICYYNFAQVNDKECNLTKAIRTLEKLRDTLRPKLMNGEVRVEYEQ
jgi:tetratricopeptide (TPR) repeat protein